MDTLLAIAVSGDEVVRVLMVGDYPDDARLGSTKVYYKLQEELRSLGHTCDLLLAPQLGPRPRQARVRWLTAPALAHRAVARAARDRGRYDIIDVASAEGSLLSVQHRLGRKYGTGVISRSHGLEHLNFRRMIEDHRADLVPKPWTRRLWYPAARMSQVSLAARLADRMIVLNEVDRAFAVRRGWKDPCRIDVVPHGIATQYLDGPIGDRPRGRGLLFCGSWDPVKGIHYLVGMMRILAAEGSPPPLTVLGPGVGREVVLSAFPPELRRVVTVVTRCSEAEVMQHYRTHDILVFPSTYEGFGMVVIEAMSQQMPVVATRVGCAPQVIRQKETGWLVHTREPRELADAVRRLMADAPLRRRTGARAGAAVSHLSWRRAAEHTLEVYELALEQGRGMRG